MHGSNLLIVWWPFLWRWKSHETVFLKKRKHLNRFCVGSIFETGNELFSPPKMQLACQGAVAIDRPAWRQQSAGTALNCLHLGVNKTYPQTDGSCS